MKKLKFKFFLFSFISFFIFSGCNSDDDVSPQISLETVGFAGLLPDGRALENDRVISYNNVNTRSNSSEGSFVYHLLSIEDTVEGITIRVEMPHLKYSDDYDVPLNSVEGGEEIYDYSLVKEKLAVGEKPLMSSQNFDRSQVFLVSVSDQKNFTGFTLGLDQQTESYLKVIELIEGSENHPTLGNINTLEVVFDVKVNLEPSDTNESPAGELEGILRMKYRENQ